MPDKLKLLMLEDNSDDATLIQKLLTRSGMQFNAIIASNEQEFLKAIDNNGYDAVLADNALPQYSSLEALKIIKEKNPDVAFILVTGTVSEEFAVDIIQKGADDYILKNNLTRLPAAIQKAIEKKKIQGEKEKALEELKQANEELRTVSAHLEKIREEEQARIAREVHDQLGQMITGLKMDLSWIKKQMSEREDRPLGMQKRLTQMSKMLDEAVIAVRKVASDLRPAIIDDFGLIEALDWQSKDFAKRSKIAVSFTHTRIKFEFEPTISMAIFRIFQEALTNVARHAEAKKIMASLEITADQIILSIKDDGKGFDASQKKGTLGLLGMKERANIIGGIIDIQSSSGNGTTVMVTIPVSS